MANIAATFTSGLVVGAGAVYAFTSFFNGQAHIVNYKLTRASMALKEVSGTRTNETLPSWKDTKPDVMNRYQKIAARLSNNAIPLAKAEWNSTIASMANRAADLDRIIDIDKVAAVVVSNDR